MATFAFTDDRVIHFVPTLIQLRANDGGGTPARVTLNLDTRDLALDEDFTTLVTQGTTVTHEKDTLNVFRINGTNAVHQLGLYESALTAATTSGITGVASRTGYDGSYSSRFYELYVELTGTDLDSGVDVTVAVTFWKTYFKQFRPFSSLSAKQVPEQTWQMIAAQSTTDILGVAITGLKNATQGDIYSVDILA